MKQKYIQTGSQLLVKPIWLDYKWKNETNTKHRFISTIKYYQILLSINQFSEK